jgi:hypothetical protein
VYCTVPQLTARKSKHSSHAHTQTQKNQAMASSTSSLASPSLTGQRAMGEFPGKSSIMLSRTVHNYTVPDHLLIPVAAGGGGEGTPWSSPSRGNGTSTSSTAGAAGVDSFVGISVLKVNKVRHGRATQSVNVYGRTMYGFLQHEDVDAGIGSHLIVPPSFPGVEETPLGVVFLFLVREQASAMQG